MEWSIINLLVVGLLIAQIATISIIVFLRKQVSNLQKNSEVLKQEQQALVSGSVGLGRKLFQFKSNLEHIEKSQAEMRHSSVSEKSFEQAAKLLQMGAKVDEVADSCHLSQGEVELLRLMISSSSMH